MLDTLMDELCNGNLPEEQDIEKVFRAASELLTREPNIVSVKLPVSICGDVHGQFPDLLQLFKIAGEVPDTNYIFMGDFVDRGHHSIETLFMLVALKLRFPMRMTLIRGNHESSSITQIYGFYDECLSKFGSANVWRISVDLFNTLPLGALIGRDIFCIHGGLSPNIKCLDEIRSLERMCEVPHTGPLCDLLWSDPSDQPGWQGSPRGAGYLFGMDVFDAFINQNALDFVCRAHQLVMEGYKWQFGQKLITVWSAPNYCYRCGNLAAVMELDENKACNFLAFDAAPPNRRFPVLTNRRRDYFL